MDLILHHCNLTDSLISIIPFAEISHLPVLWIFKISKLYVINPKIDELKFLLLVMSFVVFCRSGSLRKQILRWKKLQVGRFIWYILGTNNLGGDRIGQREELNCNAIQAKTSEDPSGLFGGHSEWSWLGIKELKLHQPIIGCRVPTGRERDTRQSSSL